MTDRNDSTTPVTKEDVSRLLAFIEAFAIGEPPSPPPPHRRLTELLAQRAVDGCEPIVLHLPRRVRCWMPQ